MSKRHTRRTSSHDRSKRQGGSAGAERSAGETSPGGRRRFSVWARVGLFLVVLAVCLVLAEGAVRLWLYHAADDQTFWQVALYENVDPAHRMFRPHHYLNYANTPGYTSRDGLNRHNSLGFRGEEIAIPKPDGVYRIVLLGGSSTYTIKVPDWRQSWSEQLERELHARGHENVEVINAGAGGYNSWESLINLETRVLDLDPDLVVVYHGINDVHARMVPPELYRGDNSGERKQWSRPPLGLLDRSALVRLAKYRLGIPMRHTGLEGYVNTPVSYMSLFANRPEMMQILEANPPIYFERNLRSMIAVARAHNVDIALSTWAWSPLAGDYVTWPHYRKGIAENNAVVKKVAAQTQTPLIDLESQMPKDKKHWTDGRHVTEPGAQKKATLVANWLEKAELLQGTQ